MVSARVLNILKRAGLTLEQAAGMPQAELRKLSEGQQQTLGAFYRPWK